MLASINLNSRYGPFHQALVNCLPQHAPSSAGLKNRPMDLSKSLFLVIDETRAHTKVLYGGARAIHIITESVQIIIPHIQKHLPSRKVNRTQLQSIAVHTCRTSDGLNYFRSVLVRQASGLNQKFNLATQCRKNMIYISLK